MSTAVPAESIAAPRDGRGPWQQYLCRACGLIYDEADGDLDSGLAPGTRFADIPEDWTCPICGVQKADFEPYVRRAPPAPRMPSAPALHHRKAGIVVVGGGTAGWAVAQAVRDLDGAVPISLVTSCDGDRYNKPELSGALARGTSPAELRRETGAAAAARLGVTLLAHTEAVGLSTATHRLRTTKGTLPYTRLVLAQGARPDLPATLPPELCWRVNDLRSWSGLFKQLAGGRRRVAVIGAGMVGCELAEDIGRAGHEVTLFARSALPLSRFLPAHAALRLIERLADVGVSFRGDAHVGGVAATMDGGRHITLGDGTVVEADLVIAATGLATQSRLVRSAGLRFDNGISVDLVTLRTSAPHVYALGDCASVAGVACRFIEPIGRQAEAIAHAVLGLAHAGYTHALPTIRLKTRSMPIVFRGEPGEGEWRVIEDRPDRLRMELWREGHVVASLAA